MRDIEDSLHIQEGILWPDGTWCYRYELTEYGWLSDDYIVLEYGTTRRNRFLREIEYAE